MQMIAMPVAVLKSGKAREGQSRLQSARNRTAGSCGTHATASSSFLQKVKKLCRRGRFLS